MKSYLYIIVGLQLLCFPVRGGENQSPFQIFLTTKATKVDLDLDGKPDVFREYSEGRLLKLVYRPSQQLEHREQFDYQSGRIQRRIWEKNVLVREIIETPQSIEKLDEFKGSQPHQKIMTIYGEKENQILTFVWGPKKDWLQVDMQTEPAIQYSSAKDCTNFFIPQTLWRGSGIPECGKYSDIQKALSYYVENKCIDSAKDALHLENGFVIDTKSCSKSDQDEMKKAIDDMIMHELPCLQKINAQRAFDFLVAVRNKSFTIYCNNGFDCPELGQCKPNSSLFGPRPSSGAYTRLHPGTHIFGASIVLEYSSPRVLNGNGFTPKQIAGIVQSNLFHEVLHHIAPAGKHHGSSEAGKNQFNDAVFGCQGLCNDSDKLSTSGSTRLSIERLTQKGCKKCVSDADLGTLPKVCTEESDNINMQNRLAYEKCVEQLGDTRVCYHPKVLQEYQKNPQK